MGANGSVGISRSDTSPAGAIESAGGIAVGSTVPPARCQLSANDCSTCRDGRSHDLDTRVAPGLDAPARVAFPRFADAKPRDEGDPAVDRDHLAVIAADPSEGGAERRRVEDADLAAGLDQRPEQAEQRTDAAPEPVVDDPHLHACTRPRGEQIDEPAARAVAMEDVHLDVHVRLCLADGLFPGRVVLRRVAQDADGVPADQRGAGRAAEHLIGRRPEREAVGRSGHAGIMSGRRKTSFHFGLTR